MFVIFGIGSPGSKSFDTRIHKLCDNCHNTTNWKVTKTTNYVSLFFINVLPVNSKYYHHCPICNYGYDVSKAEFDRLRI
jgi:zinc-ribbon family